MNTQGQPFVLFVELLFQRAYKLFHFWESKVHQYFDNFWVVMLQPAHAALNSMLVIPGGGVVGISEGAVEESSAGVSLAGAGGSGVAGVLTAGASFGGASPEISFALISNNKVLFYDNTRLGIQMATKK